MGLVEGIGDHRDELAQSSTSQPSGLKRDKSARVVGMASAIARLSLVGMMGSEDEGRHGCM